MYTGTDDNEGREGVGSIRELRRKDFEEARWFIPGVIPLQGVTLLAANEKAGKSALVMSAIASAACGEKILGHWEPTGEIGTLYLDLETPEREMQLRANMILGDREWPYRLDYVASDNIYDGNLGFPRMDQGGLEELDEYLGSHRTELVVIDLWGAFKPDRGSGSPHNYDKDVEEIGQLKMLAARHSASIILIHHTNKRNHKDWVKRISGTSGLTNACDTIVLLERARGAVACKLYVTGRYIRTGTYNLAFNDKNLSFTYVGDADQSEISERRLEIITLLTGLDEALKPHEIGRILNRSGGSVRQLLASMLQDKQVLVTYDRRYTVPVNSGNGSSSDSRSPNLK
jgi:hypothetical protein